MEFAKNLLIKQGWSSGEGLGKVKDGIQKAISVEIKRDTFGIGHDSLNGNFQWWDHVYNKTVKNIQVCSEENGEVCMKKKEKVTNLISTAIPGKVQKKTPSLLFGRFVSASSASKEEDLSSDTQDFSSKITDQELFERCGRRTGHKGARHNIHQKGKLARVSASEKTAKRKHFEESESSEERKESKNTLKEKKLKKAKKSHQKELKNLEKSVKKLKKTKGRDLDEINKSQHREHEKILKEKKKKKKKLEKISVKDEKKKEKSKKVKKTASSC